MPSIVVPMGPGALSTQTLVLEKRNAKVKPSAIFINNAGSANDADLVFNDSFTPAVTNLVGAPVPPQLIPRLNVNVPNGICLSLEDILKDIKFLGLVQVVRAVPEALCQVTFAYDLV